MSIEEHIGPYKIHLFKEQREIDCSPNNTILEANIEAQINHTHVCGGKGNCSTCRVSVMGGMENCYPRNDTEQKMANKLNFPDEIRLACQTKIHGNISIRRMVSDKLDMDLVFEQFSKNQETVFGSQQKLTIVFTDIVNYTSFAERFPPYDVLHVLNRYYRIVNAIIRDHRGIISDVAGDGVLSIFGIDSENENSVKNAVNAIKEINEKLKQFNEYLEENFNTQFEIRAGIHFGDVIVGPFDTGEMKKLAVIGDNVNYASRIETANKEFNTKLLLSEEAYLQINKEFPYYNEFETTLKGKTGCYKLYEII